MVKSKSTSLQKLLSLDKSFDTLDERIQAAAQIIGLSLDDSSQSLCPLSGNHGRADFCFRWISGHLKSSTSARASAQAWRLIRRLIQAVPEVVAVRYTSSSGLLGLLIEALAESFSKLEIAKVPTQVEAETVLQNGDKDASKQKSKSKKRKRDMVTDDADLVKIELFCELAECFKCLCDAQGKRSAQVNAPSIIQSDLVVDQIMALRLFKFWVQALITMFSTSCLLKKQMYRIAELAQLERVAAIWKSASRSSTTTDAGVAFTNEVALPVILLRNLLISKRTTLEDDPRYSTKAQKLDEELKTIVVREVVVPALTTSAQLQIVKMESALQSISDDTQTRFSGLLAMFQELLTTTEQSITFNESARLLVVRSIADFETMCVEQVSATHPKDRKLQTSWMESIFKTLLQLVERSDAQAGHRIERQILNALLNTFVDARIPLSVDTLQGLQSKYALTAPSEALDGPVVLDFDIVTAVVALDPLVLIDQADDNPGVLARLLQSTMEEQLSLSWIKSQSALEPQMVVWKIMVPLIRAASAKRYAEGFFDLWLACLDSASWSSLSISASIWRHPAVQASMARLVSTGLSIEQIKSRLQNQCSKIVDAADDATLASRLGLVVILVDTLRSVDLFDALHGPLEDILATLRKKGPDIPSNSSAMPLLWVLLTKLHRLVQSDWEAGTKLQNESSSNERLSQRDEPVFTLEEHAIVSAQKLLKKHKNSTKRSDVEISGALDYLLDVSEVSVGQPGHQEHTISTVKLLFDDVAVVNGATAVSTSQERFVILLAKAIAARPYIWLHVAPSQQRAFELALALVSSNTAPKTDNIWPARFFEVVSRQTAHKNRTEFEKHIVQHLQAHKILPKSLSTLVCGDMPLSGLAGQELMTALVEYMQNMPHNARNDPRELQRGVVEQTIGILTAMGAEKARVSVMADSRELVTIIVGIADLLDSQNLSDDTTTLALFAEFNDRLSRSFYASPSSSEAENYMKCLDDFVDHYVRSVDTDYTKPARTRMAVNHINQCHIMSRIISVDVESITDAARHMKKIVKAFSVEKNGLDMKLPRGMYEVLHAIPKQFWCQGKDGSWQRVEKARQHISETFGPKLGDTSHVFPKDTLLQCLPLDSSLESTAQDDLQQISRLLGAEHEPHDRLALEQLVSSRLLKWSNNARLSLIIRALENRDEALFIGRWILVRVALSVLQESDHNDEDEIAVNRKVLPLLLKELGVVLHARGCHAILECLILILKEKRFLVTQYGIETAIQTLYSLVTSSTSLKSASSGSKLFSQICTALHHVLQSHRPSLTGRSHLLIPLLVQLLALQYTPHQVSHTSRRIFNHPPWLFHHNHHTLIANPTAHARSYARLLTTLCNPTPSTLPHSSSSSSGTSSSLVDKVRAARQDISSSIPTIVHAYCRFELSGRLLTASPPPTTPSTTQRTTITTQQSPRETLQAGLYALFDVMDMAAPEEARVIALAAAMGGSSGGKSLGGGVAGEVVVLRREWAEWKRFGRWMGRGTITTTTSAAFDGT